jgi:hypothetical protein
MLALAPCYSNDLVGEQAIAECIALLERESAQGRSSP